jgi:hypothetical protein
MKIANPIYDVVFKYLMENNQIAKDFLSLILGIEIISVEVQAQEFVEINKQTGLRVYRIDFKATVRDKNGNLKTILIEIQKSKNGLEIERFQSYIGLNYLKQNIVLDEENVSRKVGYPITPIYLLGFRLKNVKVPVLKVERTYLNGISRKKLKAKEDFVEKLSHDLYAIQIPRLKMQVRTDLEKMLDVFNSAKYKTSDNRIFDYTGDTSDPRIARVVKHLGRAIIDDDNMLHSMLVEDEIEELLARERRQRELLDKKAQESLKKLEEAKAQTKAAEAETKAAEARTKSAKVEAESAKVEAESAKVEAESAKVEAESAKVEAESAKVEAESAKVEAESAKVEAESAKVEAESAKVEAESAKVEAESAKVEAESAKVEAESAKVEAESAKVEAESAKVEAESAKVEAESARNQAESAKVATEIAEEKTKLAISEKEEALENARLLAAKVEALQKQLQDKK